MNISTFLKTSLVLSLSVMTIAFIPRLNVRAADDLEDLLEDLDSIEERLKEVGNQIDSVDEKIAGEQNLQYSVANEIAKLDTEISRQTLTIEQKNIEIEKKNKELQILEQEIDKSSSRIEGLENDMQELEKIVRERFRLNYKSLYTTENVDALIGEDENYSYMELFKYYKALREKDKEKMESLSLKKSEVMVEKNILEDDKVEVEKIVYAIEEEKKNLEELQDTLGAQVAWKEKIIQNSKQNQNALSNKKDELNQEEIELWKRFDDTQNAIFAAKNQVDSKISRYVRKGDIIGKEGDTGVVTGDHLHFSIDANRDGYNDNPCHYLPSRVISGRVCGTSNPIIDWPMRGTFDISSWYGWRSVPYSGFHSAIDIYYQRGTSSDFIYAAHDGYVSYGQQDCSYDPRCRGGHANYAIICSDKSCSIKTGYWHLE